MSKKGLRKKSVQKNLEKQYCPKQFWAKKTLLKKNFSKIIGLIKCVPKECCLKKMLV